MRDGLPAGYDNWRLATPWDDDDFDDALAEEWYEEYVAECEDEGVEPTDYNEWVDANYERLAEARKRDLEMARAESILDDRDYWAGR